MKYRLSVGKDTVPVEVEAIGAAELSVSIDGVSHQLSYAIINGHHIRLDIDGKGYNAYVAGDSDNKWIVINGVSYRVGDTDAVATRSSRKAGVGGGPSRVTPPMPSVVVAVLVKEGDLVQKGQGVIVLSAMKMETTLSAPFDGKVTKINTSVGEKVMPGEILVDVEKDEGEN